MIDLQKLNLMFDTLFSDPDIEEKFWDWYVARNKNASAKPNVSGELQNDEEIEKWFAGDRYNDASFWSQAPYRDNGDVVGLVIDAVKHFTNSTESKTWKKRF